MEGAVGGVLAIAALVLVCAVPVLLSVRRRAVDEVVTVGSADGTRGLAIHPERGHRLLPVLAWAFAFGMLAVGVAYLRSAPYAAALFLVVGALFVYLGWARATGRAGDGTLTLTAEGIHQLWAGSDVFVPWDDVRGLVTTPQELIVETRRPARQRRTLPLLGGRRKVLQADAVSIPHASLPALPYQEMVELYATNPESRHELATDEPVERARRLLREDRAGRASEAS
ncbi:hypothetical protein [Cellulomonas humilata]|uniref:PH domain-containing protein n=1 Tax=Cellulomonas humilata TaxID=144055 RepID=A0ABU0EC22_9CELL|nr:hypothetical protein [Cellulomonas humilata]MDQ0372636.1 hypothetical protein [Cellulomonas humilata]